MTYEFNEIEKNYMSLAHVIRGITPLFTVEVTIEMIKECIANNYIVWGVDGFLPDEGWYRISQDHEKYISSEIREEQYKEILDFVESFKGQEVYFEISCDPQNKEEKS